MSTSRLNQSLEDIIKESKAARRKDKSTKKPGKAPAGGMGRRPGRRIGFKAKAGIGARRPRNPARERPVQMRPGGRRGPAPHKRYSKPVVVQRPVDSYTQVFRRKRIKR